MERVNPANVEEYAQLMTEEMGETITGARSEVEKCASPYESSESAHYARRYR